MEKNLDPWPSWGVLWSLQGARVWPIPLNVVFRVIVTAGLTNTGWAIDHHRHYLFAHHSIINKKVVH